MKDILERIIRHLDRLLIMSVIILALALIKAAL